MAYAASFFIPFVLSLALTPAVIFFAKRKRILDFPEYPKKLHTKPVPLLGGLAVYIAFFLTLIGAVVYGFIIDSVITPWHIIALVLGGSIIMAGGYLDDVYNLKPKRQLIFTVTAALVAILFGIQVRFVTHPFGGVIHFSQVAGVLITFLWLLGMMYTTKFLDGLDGLVSGVSVIGSIIIFIVSMFWDVRHSGTSLMALMLAGASLGFLAYNFYPAKIFLGEGGSVLIGYLLGILSIISGSKIATAFLIMGFPIIDTAWVIIQRMRRGISPAMGDRTHFHFSLLDLGLSPTKAVLLLYGMTLVFGFLSIFFNTKSKIIAIILLIISATIVIRKYYIKRMPYAR